MANMAEVWHRTDHRSFRRIARGKVCRRDHGDMAFMINESSNIITFTTLQLVNKMPINIGKQSVF